MRIHKTKKSKRIVFFLIIFLVGAFFFLSYVMYLNAQEKNQEYQEKIVYYESIARKERQWIHYNQVSNGALVFYKEKNETNSVVPYFSNIAARALLGETFIENDKTVIIPYMDWYLSHLNSEEDDPINGRGSIYDYQIVLEEGRVISEQSKEKYDSIDSYAASFLILMNDYYEQTGDIQYLMENVENIYLVVQALENTIDQDGLSMTDNNKRIKYIMDNSEVNQGLKDTIRLLDSVAKKETVGDGIDYNQVKQVQAELENALEKNTQAIEDILWNQKELRYEIGLDKNNKTFTFNGWDHFYAEAVSQLFPIAFGVIDSKSERAKLLYERFCQEYDWENMDHFNGGNTDFYWCALAYVSALMEDETRVNQFMSYYSSNIMENHDYPLYIAEAGWNIMACDKMIELYQNKIRKNDLFGILN